jgi:hypothetical protein
MTLSEQQTISACPHPEAVGTRWGDPITTERQALLILGLSPQMGPMTSPVLVMCRSAFPRTKP